MTGVASLVDTWRAKADMLQSYAPGVAQAFRDAADELCAILDAEGHELLTLQQAACTTGYHPETLGRLIRKGKIPNAGRRGRPRILRCDLPTRPGHRVAAIPLGPYDPAADARLLASRRKGAP